MNTSFSCYGDSILGWFDLCCKIFNIPFADCICHKMIWSHMQCFLKDWGFPSCTKVKSTHQPVSRNTFHFIQNDFSPNQECYLTPTRHIRQAEVVLLSKRFFCAAKSFQIGYLTHLLLTNLFHSLDPNYHSKHIKKPNKHFFVAVVICNSFCYMCWMPALHQNTRSQSIHFWFSEFNNFLLILYFDYIFFIVQWFRYNINFGMTAAKPCPYIPSSYINHTHCLSNRKP